MNRGVKWLSRVVDKVTGPVTPPADGVKWQDKESVERFKKLWDEFTASTKDQLKGDTLDEALLLFCNLARSNKDDTSQLVQSLVDVRQFSFVVARQLVVEISKLRKGGPEGPLSIDSVLHFLSDTQDDGATPGPGSTMLAALEILVTPPLDVQSLLDAGLLSTMVTILYRLLSPLPDSNIPSSPKTAAAAAVAPAEDVAAETVSSEPAEAEVADEAPAQPPSALEGLAKRVDGWRRRLMVEGSVVHIMKALARHPAAAQSLAEDDSLQLLFHMVAMDPSKDKEGQIVTTPKGKRPLHKAQLRRHAIQVLNLLLTSDGGGVAVYIRKHLLINVLLGPIIEFDGETGDAAHAVGIVGLILQCVRLSCKPDAKARLREDLRAEHGYFWFTQTALRMLTASASSAGEVSVHSSHSFSDSMLTPSPSMTRNGVSDSQEGESMLARFDAEDGRSASPQQGELLVEPAAGHGSDGMLTMAPRLSQDDHGSAVRTTVPPPLLRLLDMLVEIAEVPEVEAKTSHHARTSSTEKAPTGRPGPRLSVTHSMPPRAATGSRENLPMMINAGEASTAFSTDAGPEAETKVCDMEAVQVLQDVFLGTTHVGVQLEVLDRVLALFASHPDNYVAVQELRTLPLFIQRMADSPPILQDQLLKVLEYAVTVVNCVPEQELLSLVCLLQQPVATQMSWKILCFFNKLLSFDRQYKNVFREVGLLDVLVEDMKHLQPPAQPAGHRLSYGGRSSAGPASPNSHPGAHPPLPSPISPGKPAGGGTGDSGGSSVAGGVLFEDELTRSLAWDTLLAVLRKSPQGQHLFRKAAGWQSLLALLACPRQRSGALGIVSSLVSEDMSQVYSDELRSLVTAARTGQVSKGAGATWRLMCDARSEILWGVYRILNSNPAAKDTFCEAEGFNLTIPILHAIRSSDAPPNSPCWSPRSQNIFSPAAYSEAKDILALRGNLLPAEDPPIHAKIELVDALMHVLTAAVKDHPHNRTRLHAAFGGGPIGNGAVKQTLHATGLLTPEHEDRLLDLLVDLALEQDKPPARQLPLGTSPRTSIDLSPSVMPKLEGGSSTGTPGTPGDSQWLQDSDDARSSADDGRSSSAAAPGGEREDVYNACAIQLLIECLPLFSASIQLRLLARVYRLSVMGPRNQESLTSVGCVGLLLEAIRPLLYNPSSPLVMFALQIVEVLGAYRLSPSELRTLAWYMRQSKDSPTAQTGHRFLSMFERMARNEGLRAQSISLSPFVELSMLRLGHAGLRTSLGERSWPPPAGYSFVCWLRFQDLRKRGAVAGLPAMTAEPVILARHRPGHYSTGSGSIFERGLVERTQLATHGRSSSFSRAIGFSSREEFKMPPLPPETLQQPAGPRLQLFTVATTDEKGSPCMEIYIDELGTITFATGPSSRLTFPGVQLEEGVWYHVAVVHNKPNALAGLFQSSQAWLYIDGSLRQMGKLSSTASPAGKPLQVTIGTSATSGLVSKLSWRLGPCYLFEEVLPSQAIFFMYALGRGYRGLFQDTDMTRFLPYEACGGNNLAVIEALDKDQSGASAASSALGGLLGKSTSDIQLRDLSAPGTPGRPDGSTVVWDSERPQASLAQLATKKLIFAYDGTHGELCNTATARSMLNLVDPYSSSASPFGGLPKVARLFGDIQICCPCSIADGIRKIGGVAVVLALLEIAETRENIHLTLSLLASILRHNPRNAHDMTQIRGYHLLALFLHHRMALVGIHELDILLQIAACEGTAGVRSGRTGGGPRGGAAGTAESASESGDPAAAVVPEEQASALGSEAGDLLSGFETASTAFADETSPEAWHTIVLANAEMVEHVLLDWTLWITSPVNIQLAVLAFFERLVGKNKFRRHNITGLRKFDIMSHLLVTLQRGSIETVVLEKAVGLIAMFLEDGFLQPELKSVAEFVIMTFRPTAHLWESHREGMESDSLERTATDPAIGSDGGLRAESSGRTDASAPSSARDSARGTFRAIRRGREPHGQNVVIRNMLMEMLLELQLKITSEEVLDMWHNKTVSSKIVTFMVDEDVHSTTLRWALVMLGLCLATSPGFAAKFKSSGGYQTLATVLPCFYDEPEVYYILFRLLFGRPVYPRQPEVRVVDFYSLVRWESAEELHFPELLDSVIAMIRAGFDRIDPATMSATAFSKVSAEEMEGGFARLSPRYGSRPATSLLDEPEHPTYSRLMSGAGSADLLVAGTLQFMLDLASKCRGFSSACRRPDVLESFVEVLFSCARSAAASPALHEAMRAAVLVSQTPTRQHLTTNGPGIMPNVTIDPPELAVIELDTPRSEPPTSSGPFEMVEDTQAHGAALMTAVPALAALNTPSGASVGSPGPFGMGSRGSSPQIASGMKSPLAGIPTWLQVYEDQERDFEAEALGGSRFPLRVTPQILLQIDVLGTSGGTAAAAVGVVLDVLCQVLADAVVEQSKGTGIVEVVLDAVPLDFGPEAAIIFQGLCLSRLVIAVQRRLTKDAEAEKGAKLDKTKWAPNIEALSWMLVDRVYLGALAIPDGPMKALNFLLSMLRLANVDGRVEEATAGSRGLLQLPRDRNRAVEPYVQALLKNLNRMVMYAFLPAYIVGESEDFPPPDSAGGRNRGVGSQGELGMGAKGLDIGMALRLFLDNKKLTLCASNVDNELICCLVQNGVNMLLSDRDSVRSLALEIWKELLRNRWPVVEELLTVKAKTGEVANVLSGGFDNIFFDEISDFFQWLVDNEEEVRRVLEAKAGMEWSDYVGNAAKLPMTKMKHLELRRRKEMTRRTKDRAKAVGRHAELTSERRLALEMVRETMAAELRELRQEKYGWVLHAEREWQGTLQHLVHERGIWGSGDAAEVQWELNSLEGPFRMRKKLGRCAVRVDLSAPHGVIYAGEEEDMDEELLNDEAGPAELDPERGFLADSENQEFYHRFCVGQAKNKDETIRRTLDKDYLESYADEDEEVGMVDEDKEYLGSIAPPEEESAAGSVNDISAIPSRLRPLRSNSVASRDGSSPRIAEQESVEGTPNRKTSGIDTEAGDSDRFEYAGETRKEIMDLQDDGEHLIRPFLEPGDRIKARYNCERVVCMDKKDGIFLIGELALYVIDNYYVDGQGRIWEKEGEGDVSVLDKALGVKKESSMTSVGKVTSDGGAESGGDGRVGGWADTAEAWLGGRAWAYNGEAWAKENTYTGPGMSHNCRVWKLDSVHEMLKRRYQLRPVAIELFSMDGFNDLLVFHINERDDVFKALLAMSLPRNSMLDTTISAKAEGNEAGRLFKMMARSFSKRWQSGEISNFQYLMHLNTLAGRGYNDITQYPVFPWVLADYSSAELDLSNPDTFRRFDKPMGCQDPDREEEFKRRYDSWEDPEIPKFHYGSHYSSAGIVLYYLIRLQPFARENQELQGGRFDHADRLFTNLKDTWMSASQGNTADVKELTPEFYYMPEFLQNIHGLDLGTKQTGEKVQDVTLPAWANGSTREFVRKHREALESQYVSEHLHEWIDLIFGHQQQGKGALDATNVFFYLTYEGSVDIDAIADQGTKTFMLAQINHFGQTPRQLFLKAHPKRRSHQKAPPVHALRHYDLLVAQEVKSISSAVSQIVIHNDRLLVVGSNRVLRPPGHVKYFAWGFSDRSLRLFSYENDRLLSTHEGLHDDGPVQCAGVSKDGRKLVTGGEDGVVAVWRMRKDGVKGQRRLHLLKALCAHSQSITCLAVCQSYSLVVSGSEDRTVIFWELKTLEFVRQLPELPAAATAVHVNELTGDVVTAAGTSLAVWSVNGECLAIINTSHLMSETVVSITTPQFSDWMETHHILTGHRDGSIKLWAREFQKGLLADVEATPPKSRRSLSLSAVTAAVMASPTDASVLGADDLGPMASPSAEHCGHHNAAGLYTGGKTPEYRLVQRKVLSWHRDPVTALYVAPDLKQIFSGDKGGHVACWALPEEGMRDHFQQDSQVTSCSQCRRKFAMVERRHHCCNCGRVLCSRCCANRVVLEDLGYFAPVRVCSDCYELRIAMGASGTPRITPRPPAQGQAPPRLPPKPSSRRSSIESNADFDKDKRNDVTESGPNTIRL